MKARVVPQYEHSRLEGERLQSRLKYAWRFECMTCNEMVYVFGASNAKMYPGSCAICTETRDWQQGKTPIVLKDLAGFTEGSNRHRNRAFPPGIKFSEELWAVVAISDVTGDELLHCIYLDEHGKSMKEP